MRFVSGPLRARGLCSGASVFSGLPGFWLQRSQFQYPLRKVTIISPERTRCPVLSIISPTCDQGLQAYGVSCLESARRVWPAYLGSTMEFYELVTYLYAGAALQRNFFSQSGAISSSLGVGPLRPLTGPPPGNGGRPSCTHNLLGFNSLPLLRTPCPSTLALQVWIGHSCTFLIRPIGGVVFGWVGDCYGRRVSMLATVIGESTSRRTGARSSCLQPPKCACQRACGLPMR